MSASDVDPFDALIEREARKDEEQHKYEEAVRVEAHNEAIRHDARARAARAEAIRAMRLPPEQDDYTHAADVAYVQTMPPEIYAVDELLKRGQNATLTAGFKTGKTGMVCDLGRCVANGEPFLD